MCARFLVFDVAGETTLDHIVMFDIASRSLWIDANV